MQRSKNGILSKITTLKINSNSKLYPKKNSQKYITPRHTAVLKNPISSTTSAKIKVNILNNEENINSNNIQNGIRKSKSRQKLISNKSFNNKTVKNKNKKNETNFNSSINTFFTTQNEGTNYTNFNTEIKDINANTKTKGGKNKTIKKRKSFGLGTGAASLISIEKNSTNDFINKTNYSVWNNKILKKTKSNASIKINLNKNINSSVNNIKTLTKKVENNNSQKNKIRATK